MKKNLVWLLSGLFLIETCGMVRADVRLPHIFGDNMVLQREIAVPVWGWADAGENISIQLGEQSPIQTITAANGRWKANLLPMPAGGPFTLVVKGKNEVKIHNVMVGEVWLCSGQSNMEFAVGNTVFGGTLNAEQEIASADHPAIRQFLVPKRASSQPEEDANAQWTVCTPHTVGGFTAVGYFMARRLSEELKAPVGIINAAWGGTRIEPWTPPVGFTLSPQLIDIHQQVIQADPHQPEYRKKLEEFLPKVEEWIKKSRDSLQAEKLADLPPPLPPEIEPLAARKEPHQQPTTLFNGMISPWVGYAIRGTAWYQGESNHDEGKLYTEKMKALIGGWRQLWGMGDFPFYYVQIAPFNYGKEPPYLVPEFWAAQSAALSIPNTGMAVINDIGDLGDIHPRNKQEVGRRLSLLALAKTYGKQGLICGGPVFKSLSVEGDKLRVNFENAQGLASRDGKPLSWFEVCDENANFVKAVAAIEGETVILSAPGIRNPVAMRFAWSEDAEPNLVNGAGLPASAFIGGEIPHPDFLAGIPETRNYELVYGLDLSKLGPNIPYDPDNRAKITGPFDRIAYYLELQGPGSPIQYVYVSMDAFTHDLNKIGIPTVGSGAFFQQKVANMTVISNVKELATGSFPEGGNIEFWPNNYAPQNSAGVPNASSSIFDFGDQPTDPVDGYGSMQIHNYNAKQTLLAINHWKAGSKADIGIGNSPGDARDWTFTANAQIYTLKRLRILVHLKKL